MSIADLANDAPARLKAPAQTVVTLDIERLKGTANVEFWDLGEFKNRRMRYDSVAEWPRTILVCWRWYGEKAVRSVAEWDEGGAEGMLRTVWNVYDKADIVIGHNLAAFDTKHLASGWRDLGLPPPSPFKVVDTLKEVRKRFGDESKTLGALCDRLGIPTKVDSYDADRAREACAGNVAAQRRLTAYCRGDVVASEALYDRIRPWIKHPHAKGGNADDRPTCPNCWGDRLERNGTVLADQITYIGWRCLDCGTPIKSSRHSRAAITRGA